MPVELSDFFGEWRIDRDIRQHSGGAGRFEGTAVWTPEAGGAVYTETGFLSLPGQGRFQAERSYVWDHDLRVCFDDGRFFHQVPPKGGEAAHWCDPDQYDASYDFDSWPNWSCTWRVQGPRKDYTMISRYSPTSS
ncbi:DUF6314 family protein [Thalassococcus lentus]|uniref:DUF6314 family protein n=1 Tax=Thalassococcus lentus TaxID=1210524 RepID=A0ABT4XRP2_9RHOB|nr:DUF6314 family protein [Thalassococcus lentus]MDA7424513.1 DUF6314 family protein [Thalassococcus lentus]